jgi:hypothetical protein
MLLPEEVSELISIYIYFRLATKIK